MHKKTLLERAKELEENIKLEKNKILLGKNKYYNKGKNLVDKSKTQLSNFINEMENPSGTLFKKYEQLQLQNKNDKSNLNLLERELEERNEYAKLNKRKRYLPPAKVIESVDAKIENPDVNKYDRILHYATKYRIPMVRAGVKVSYKDLAKIIHKFEMKNIKSIMRGGKDRKYEEYGLYIKLL